MKIMTSALAFTSLINRGFEYVINTSRIYKIDESHALKHSMEVFGMCKQIYDSELKNNIYLKDQQLVIFMAAIGHDMCDKKYMDEKEGILRYKNYLSDFMNQSDLDIMDKIISTMSYSKVKINGYPDLGEYQLAYHIVREADLLAAYDIDRCVMYTMYRDSIDYTYALQNAIELFDNRVFKMRKDKLFKTSYSKKESLKLHKKAEKDVNSLKKILEN